MKDGHLTLHGKKLIDVPMGQWFHVEMRCAVGKMADGKWEMTVRLPGGEEKTFADLACDPKFDGVFWYGFAASANDAGVMYLDNVEFAPVSQ